MAYILRIYNPVVKWPDSMCFLVIECDRSGGIPVGPPLNYAALHNKLRSLQTLISLNAIPTLEDSVGRTPLFCAVEVFIITYSFHV